MCASCAYEPREMRSRDMTEENIQTSHGWVTGTTRVSVLVQIRRALSLDVWMLFGGERERNIPDIVMSSDTQPSQVFALPKH